MKRPIIKDVEINNKRKVITITISGKRKSYDLPFWRLRIKPTLNDRIHDCFIDPDLGMESITYTLESGTTDSIHLDAFLDFNNDPDHLRKNRLYDYTNQANDFIDNYDVSISELARMMNSSRSQVYRLLDPANNSKSVDSMLRLLGVLGITPEFKTKKKKNVA